MRPEIIRRTAWMLASVFLLAGGTGLLTSCAGSKPPAVGQIQGASERTVDLRYPPLDEAARTQVLILATPHLATLGDKFDSSLLSSLLVKLELFKPDIIAVEQMPPHVIQAMQSRREDFPEVLEQFAGIIIGLGQIAQERLGLSRYEASIAANELLHRLGDPAESSDTNRIRAQLVVHLLAAYEYASAVLQWSYMLEAEQAHSDIIPQEVADDLMQQVGVSNENVSVAIALARRLGLQKVEAIDDHTDKDLFIPLADKLAAQLQGNPAFESATAAPIYVESSQRLEEAIENGDLLPYYLFLNSTEYGMADVDAQFHVFFRTQLPSGLDRARSAVWELRNLNMAAHIRRITAMHPGKRVLVVIGAGHKPFLDVYLSQMMDVKVLQLSEIVSRTQ